MDVKLKRRKSKAELPEVDRAGRDEMNLAEFPTAILTTRAIGGIKTLRFRDSHGELTVTGSDALGLPTPIDTDVMVALIEMTKNKNRFSDAKVNFTRYELIRLIGWANVGSSYERLKESLDRWAGVLLIYDGCWWDNRLKRYVSKTVHIVEDVLIADGKMKTEKDGQQHTVPLSSFSWSSHFMESFQANNLKSLDTVFYFSLKLPSSKQLFRFLDKRFGSGRSEWTFDLEQLAFEHVGLSRNYDPPKIKEKLGKAIDELEDKGFLKPLTREERYFKTGDVWRIRLLDGRSDVSALPAPIREAEPEPPALVTELTKREVTRITAEELVKQCPAEAIQAKLEVFDWLVEKNDKRVAKSPGGYLVDSIRKDYATPKGFVPRAERRRRESARREAEHKAGEQLRRKREDERRDDEERQAVDAEIKRLTLDERAELEAELLAQASPEERQAIEDPSVRMFRDTMILGMLRNYFTERRRLVAET
jgi:Replication initiator protein A